MLKKKIKSGLGPHSKFNQLCHCSKVMSDGLTLYHPITVMKNNENEYIYTIPDQDVTSDSDRV